MADESTMAEVNSERKRSDMESVVSLSADPCDGKMSLALVLERSECLPNSFADLSDRISCSRVFCNAGGGTCCQLGRSGESSSREAYRRNHDLMRSGMSSWSGCGAHPPILFKPDADEGTITYHLERVTTLAAKCEVLSFCTESEHAWRIFPCDVKRHCVVVLTRVDCLRRMMIDLYESCTLSPVRNPARVRCGPVLGARLHALVARFTIHTQVLHH